MGGYNRICMTLTFEVRFVNDAGDSIIVSNAICNWAYEHFTRVRLIHDWLTFVDRIMQLEAEWIGPVLYIRVVTDGYINDYLDHETAGQIMCNHLDEMYENDLNKFTNEEGTFRYMVEKVNIEYHE